MTEKQWKIIDEEFISYTGGTAQLISNGECKVHLWETPRDAQLFCDKLNALHEENQTLKQENKELQFAYDECSNNKLFSRRKLETENKNLKDENTRLSKDKQLAETEIIRIRQTLNDAIETERTNIGQSVLKQFKEQIQ